MEEVDEIAAIKAYNKRMEESEGGASSSSSSSSSPAVMFSHPHLSSVADTSRAYESVKVLENKHKEHDQLIVR